jgi:hypothetical protein
MNRARLNQIETAQTFCTLASTHKLVATEQEQYSVRRQSNVEIERAVIARERMRLMKRMAI